MLFWNLVPDLYLQAKGEGDITVSYNFKNILFHKHCAIILIVISDNTLVGTIV